MSKLRILVLLVLLLSSVFSARVKWTVNKTLEALNKARTDPNSIKTFIHKEYKDKIHPPTGNCSLNLPGLNMDFKEDCPQVFTNMDTYLQTDRTATALKLDLGMSYGAYLHCKYLGLKAHKADHADSKGDKTAGKKIGPWTSKTTGVTGENIHRTTFVFKNESHMIADMVLGDGVTGKGHRLNIFNKAFKNVGIGIFQANTDGDSNQYICLSFAAEYTCDKCNQISCDMQKEMGWSKYRADTKKTGECEEGSKPSTSGNSTTNGTSGSNSTNTSSPKPKLGTSGIVKGLELVESSRILSTIFLTVGLGLILV